MKPFLSLLAALFALALAVPVAAQDGAASPDWRAAGPSTLVLTYHVAPADRVAARAALRSTLLPSLAAMQREGKLRGYRLLANRYVDSAVWDFLLTLDFSDAAALARWRTTEEIAPGGLSPDLLHLVGAIETAPGSVLRSSPIVKGDPTPVYLVVPYDYLVSTDAYLKYVDGYLVPQVNGWTRAGALEGYDLFLPRYAAGRQWSALLLLAYRGDAGLAARDSVVASVRDTLAATAPAWKALAEGKGNVRTEKQPIVADVVLP